MKDEKKVLSEFTREMMGSSVAHMTDDELDRWMAPFRALVDKHDMTPGFPAWFLSRRNAARAKLLATLLARSAASPKR